MSPVPGGIYALSAGKGYAPDGGLCYTPAPSCGGGGAGGCIDVPGDGGIATAYRSGFDGAE